ncbi:MFS transporter [Streptomyces sp. 796.1]|uniref:MFS transporter n=1 Tax=Streptomyces sp. 796.1 TaxID=3163029 RepID=UPI0039C9A573
MLAAAIPAQLYLAIPLADPVGDFYDVGPDAAAWTGSAFSLTYALGFLLFGPLSDRYGRRPVLVAGTLALAAASALVPLAPSYGWFLALRALQGLAAATFAPVALAYVAERAPAARRPLALSVLTTGLLAAGLAGQAFGQAVAGQGAWRAAFWPAAIVYLVAAPLLQRLLSVDPVGSAAPAAPAAPVGGAVSAGSEVQAAQVAQAAPTGPSSRLGGPVRSRGAGGSPGTARPGGADQASSASGSAGPARPDGRDGSDRPDGSQRPEGPGGPDGSGKSGGSAQASPAVPAASAGGVGSVLRTMGRLLRTPAVLAVFCAAPAVFGSFVALYAVLGDHLTAEHGYSSAELLGVQAVGALGLLAAPLVSRYAGARGPRFLSVTGYLTALGGLLLAQVTAVPAVLIVGSVVFVAGIGLVVPGLVGLLHHLAPHARGAAVSCNTAVLFLGASLGQNLAAAGSYHAVGTVLAVALLAAAVAVAATDRLAARGGT